MNMCQAHWDKLREAIFAAGLKDLVANDGQLAGEQLVNQIETGEINLVNYDPLMSAFFAIASKSQEIIQWAGGNYLYLMFEGPEDPVEGFPGYEDRTWPKCTICYPSLLHEMTCTGCDLPKENAFDYYIDRAVDDQVKKAKELGLIE